MNRLAGLRTLMIAVGCLGLAAASSAQNLLTNGDFETVPPTPPEFPGWELSETVTGLPGQEINSAEAREFANNPGGTTGEFGLWLRAFAGNTEQNLVNEQINADLTQTVAASPGVEYTFSGEGLYEGNYSGGVPVLDPTSPSGSILSPTTNTFEISFLDSGGNVIGSASQNVSDDVFNGFGYTAVTPVVATAPAGTTDLRVSARAENMVFNTDPGQSAFYDNFSLTGDDSPGTELLVNGDLNAFDPPDPDDIIGFTLVEPEGLNTLATAGFANNTPDGSLGIWVRSFVEGSSRVDADLVPASEGDEFTFSAQALFEAEYSGGDPLQPTETLLELTYFDGGDSVISSDTFDVASIVSNGGGFTPVSLMSTAPAGTANVQASVVINNTVSTMGAQSAFFDDLSLTLATTFLLGDADGDGDVDGDDLIAVQSQFGSTGATPLLGDADGDGDVDGDDLIAVQSEFGSVASVAVPEPAAAALAALAVAGFAARRRNA